MKNLMISAGLAVLSLSPLAGLAAVKPNFPTGAYTYVCTVKNAMGDVAGAKDGYILQVVNASADVLAECPVADPDQATGVNCILSVPLSTNGGTKTAKAGDSVSFRMLEADRVLTGSRETVIGETDTVSNLVLQIVRSRKFASTQSPSGFVEVSEAYLERIADWLEDTGDPEYKPDGDYDGDGFSNYAEYVAGTDPFDPESHLKISSFAADPSAGAAVLTFVGQPGRVYGVKSAASLSSGVWQEAKFATSADGAARRQVVCPADGSKDEQVIFLAPTGSAAFFKVEAK